MSGKLGGQGTPSSVPLRELWHDVRTYGWKRTWYDVPALALVWGVLCRLCVTAYFLGVAGAFLAFLVFPELGT